MNSINMTPIIRLVLIHSDPECRRNYKQALEGHSTYRFEVVEASTGRQGLKLIRSEAPDCIVVDGQLPDFDTRDLLADLAANVGEDLAPVIVVRSEESAAAITGVPKNLVADYLAEPLDPSFAHRLPDLIAHDVSRIRLLREKNEALEQLRKAEAKYRALVEQIPAITYIASLEAPGKLLYVSPQTRQLGYSPETWLDDPLGIGLLKWIHPDDREAVIEQFATTYERHVPLYCEYRVITHDGKVRWMRDQADIVRDDAGHPLFLQGTLVDIDKDKALERELEQYRRRLDELEAERAARLQKEASVLRVANANPDRTLCDRVEFEQHLEYLLASSRESQAEHVLCYLDLDHFKIFTDTYGSAAGTRLLQSVGDALERRLRQSDILGRLGGDKFGLLLENCPLERAWIVANNLRDAVKNCSLSWAGKDLWISVSIGITALRAAGGNAASVLRDADSACRIAKMKGRDRTYIFDGRDTDELRDALTAKSSAKPRRTDWPVIVDTNAMPLRKKA
ncbi:GGDEF domain-containing response regulator [Methylocaldum szegediense]|uniref:PAS domain S-box-containing protein/diguanylate cyclase (GGDEF)-like protein n=1 Tax=Methylocaldum szegediense TaxID=73780 RepID=A0ABM9HXS3_9GAMM|nr:diguanylate cyclase [Methylocaldum szegediense]CAI8755659.1 PAS domain S-box-containing protein/diguanylate cyclase (GGDEF)-like protein [Methylocaldum szegediense]